MSVKVKNWIVDAIDVINQSTSAQDYCRRLTLHPTLGTGMRGNHVFALTSTGKFKLMGGFGHYPFPSDAEFSQLKSSLLSRSVSSRSIERETVDTAEGAMDIQAVPGLKGGTPNGVIVTCFDVGTGGTESFEMDPEQVQAYYLTLGLFISASGFGAIDAAEREPTNRPLTDRQYAILVGMAEGKTNLQMASEMHVSESMIKQETVKIYRSLGVATRQQAAVKAKAMAMLPEGIDLSF